jgi:hypothetical protein
VLVALAALAFWVVTALGGALMIGITLRTGNADSSARESRWPDLLLLAHPLLAAIGLVLWIVYMSTSDRTWAWWSFAVLVVTAMGGGLLFRTWWRLRRDARSHPAMNARVVELQIPSVAVHAHGALAAVTLLLTLLCALGVAGTTHQ